MSDIKSTDRDTCPVDEAATEEGGGLHQNQRVRDCNVRTNVVNMRAATPYLCALYVATAGHQGNLLGSDEQEIVLLIYVVIDMTTNTIVGIQQYLVKPTEVDQNENMLSDQVTSDIGITEKMVKTSGIPLHDAIEKFDTYVKSLNIEPQAPMFRIVTDGQLPIRQCLHREASIKDIELPEYYNVFHDLRKDFSKFYNAPQEQTFNSITDLVNYLEITHEIDPQFYVSEVKDMVNIVQRLIADGHTFNSPEIVQLKLEPGICQFTGKWRFLYTFGDTYTARSLFTARVGVCGVASRSPRIRYLWMPFWESFKVISCEFIVDLTEKDGKRTLVFCTYPG